MGGRLRAWALALVAALLPVGPAASEGAPLVVVELFTSQACPACPPADRLLKRLSQRADVLPLAFHVDYWDYLGWVDVYARPEHTLRQKRYARAAGKRMIYTPQIVVGGRDHVAGANEMALSETLLAHAAQPRVVTIGLARQGDTLRVLAVATAPEGVMRMPERLVVQLVRFTPSETMTILAGENADRTADFVNIVRSLDVIARWDGTRPLEVSVPVPGPEAAAVLVQAEGAGPILGAAVLR